MEIINALRDWSKRASTTAQPYMKAAADFAVRNRELLIGGVGGYVAGKAIESIPIVGRLLRPLPSLLLGVGGALLGRAQDQERRKIEALEKLNRT